MLKKLLYQIYHLFLRYKSMLYNTNGKKTDTN